jgi:uncharacterized protein YbaP (TraB family)
LVGTLHRLPPGVDLPPSYRRWCSQADRLLMEVEPAALEVSTLLPLTMERALQPPGGSLEADLGPVRFRRVGDRLAPLGLAPELLRQLRPWAALLLLSGRELERQGFDAAGVDQRLARCAAASGRPVEGLETAAAQLNLLADLPLNQQRRAIEQALAEPRPAEARLGDLAAAWQRGQVDRLEALLPEADEAGGDPIGPGCRGWRRNCSAPASPWWRWGCCTSWETRGWCPCCAGRATGSSVSKLPALDHPVDRRHHEQGEQA